MKEELARIFLCLMAGWAMASISDIVRKWNKFCGDAVFVILFMLLLSAVGALSGCTSTAMKRIATRELVQCCHLPSPIVTEYTSFVHREFLMRSKMSEAEAVVDGDYRHYSIGTREQMPDPNSIDATFKGGGRSIKEVAPLLIGG